MALSLTVSLVLLSAACESMMNKPFAFGRQKEILVICDDDIWDAIEKPLREQVERELHAVRWEKIFEIAHVTAENARQYKEWDKIILIETLENPKLLSFVVADSTMKKIKEGEGLFFNQIDVWAKNQRVTGLASPSRDGLQRLVIAHGDKIFNAFIRQVEREELFRMYHSGRDTLLADSLAVAEGFSFTLPRVYEQIRQDSLEPNQLLFVHQNPVRSVCITWEDNPGEWDLSPGGLAARRDSTLSYAYASQYTHPERVDTSTVVRNGVERLRIYGTWENSEEISGGVYISHIINTPAGDRRYYIDCQLFSPDMRKNKYRFIYQLDHILDTFQLHPDHKAPAQGRFTE
jgi:hypothetical protein